MGGIKKVEKKSVLLSEFGTVGYLVSVYEQTTPCRLVEAVLLSARPYNKHYLLTRTSISSSAMSAFGILDSMKGVDAQLYFEARAVGRILGAEHQCENIEDLTRHAVSEGHP